jgi:hypothetical protein
VERKGVIVARRIIIAASITFALALIAYGIAIGVTARSAVDAYMTAYQSDDPQIETLGIRRGTFAKNEGPPMSELERVDRCIRSGSDWTIEDPGYFALSASCATVKAPCGRKAEHVVLQLERRSTFHWYVTSLQPGRCK